MKKHQLYQACLFLLVLLWAYASLSKLLQPVESSAQMHNQVFSRAVADVLTWLVPLAELATGLLLTMAGTARYGLISSAVLLAIFTGYIAGGLLHWYVRMPCSCGGVIRGMSWRTHLFFNLFFLLLSFTAIYLHNRERRAARQG